MDSINPSNGELASQYYSVVSQYGAIKKYIDQRRTIESSPFDIHTYYREHGSLRRMNGLGIMRETRIILERIMDKGVEEVRRNVLEHAERQIRETQFDHYVSKRVTRLDEDGGSWDNVTRLYDMD